MRGVLTDPQFWLAVAAAAVLWMFGYLWLKPVPDPGWPWRETREALVLAALYPVVEELLFRGGLQGWLLERTGMERKIAGLTRANWITSLVFTALHFVFHPPFAAAAVILPSLVFGHFRDRHGRLHAPILLHVYYNLGYFWIFAS